MDILGLPPTQPTSCTSNTAHHPGWVGSVKSQTVTSFQFPDTPSWAICLHAVFLIPLVSTCLYERRLRLGILRLFRPLSIPLLVTCSLGLTNHPINWQQPNFPLASRISTSRLPTISAHNQPYRGPRWFCIWNILMIYWILTHDFSTDGFKSLFTGLPASTLNVLSHTPRHGSSLKQIEGRGFATLSRKSTKAASRESWNETSLEWSSLVVKMWILSCGFQGLDIPK